MGNPTVPPLYENRHTGGYVVWDPSDGMITRDPIVLGAGAGVCLAGLVLAALMTGGAATAVALGTNTGNGTFSAIVVASQAKVGNYTVEFDDPTHFVISDPTGVEVGHGNTGAAVTIGGLTFTITAGATPFAPADSFTITVTGVLKYGPWDPTATDGHQFVGGILFNGYRDATLIDKKAVANVRGPMKVNANELVYGPNVTNQQPLALAQLAKLGILSV